MFKYLYFFSLIYGFINSESQGATCLLRQDFALNSRTILLRNFPRLGNLRLQNYSTSNQNSTLSTPIEDLKIHKTLLTQLINESGFALLKLPDTRLRTLKNLCGILGDVQKNKNSDEEGISEIVGYSTPACLNQVVSTLEFFPHTDGAYLNGLSIVGEQIKRVMPPKLVLLQCIEPAIEGGTNFLVDSQQILTDVIMNSPHLLDTLLSSQDSMICHHDLIVNNVPIYECLSPNRYTIRYSFDKGFYSTKKKLSFLQEFNDKYINNPRYRKFINLKPLEALLIDNRRMLHGRTSFNGNRKFKRAWIYDDERSCSMLTPSLHEKFHYLSQKKYDSPFKKYESFSTIPRDSSIPLLELDLEIKLTPDQNEKLKSSP